ncbi:MAG: hypothetical protein ABIW47_10835 [Ginsengibacter sp.]
MQFKLMILILCISTSCLDSIASFSNFSNTFAKEFNKEAPYIGNNHANFPPVGFNIKYYSCKWEINPAVRYIKEEVTAHFFIF